MPADVNGEPLPVEIASTRACRSRRRSISRVVVVGDAAGGEADAVDVAGDARLDRGLAVAEQVVGDADARADVLPVGDAARCSRRSGC